MLDRKKKVAIVDDDTELTDELKKILSDSGYLVAVYNSPQFVNEFVNKKPDIVLLDVWFNGTADGLNEAKAFKIQEKIKFIPIILMSSDQRVKKYAELIGTNKYLNKPFDPEKMLSMMKEILAN